MVGKIDCLPAGLAGSVRSFQGASLKRILEAGVVGVERSVLAGKLTVECGVGWEVGGEEAVRAGGRSSKEPEALC